MHLAKKQRGRLTVDLRELPEPRCCAKMHSIAPCFRVIIAVATLLLGACGAATSTDVQSNAPAAEQPMLSSAEIIARVYDPWYELPAGFFVDHRASTPQSYTVYHVKDASLSYELCTDDYNTARAWEEADNLSRTVSGYFVDTYENDQYFEIVRELSYEQGAGNVPGTTSPGFARVFKCARVNRNGVDRNLRNGFGGRLNVDSLTTAEVRQFAEYLWQFTYFDNARRKVVASFSSADPTAIRHTLRLAFVINQGVGRCDRVEIFDWTFGVKRDNGDVDRQFQFREAFEARQVNGIPEQCG